MSASSEKSFALVGFGSTGQEYLDVLRERPDLVLAGVVESDPTRRMRARELGCPSFLTLAQLLARRPAPHIAAICSPPSGRLAISETLLLAGADLFVEGPLAPTLVEADRIATRAERLSRVARSCFPFRTAEPVLALRRAIAGGVVGRLCFVEVALQKQVDAHRGFWGDPSPSNDGAWMDLGLHGLDLAEALAGPIDRLRLVEMKREQGAAAEDEVVVEAVHPHRVRSRLRLSWNDKSQAPLAHCVGTDGDLLLGHAQTIHRCEDGERALTCGYDARAALQASLDAFLCSRLRPDVDDSSALAVSWLRAGYKSVTSGRFEIA